MITMIRTERMTVTVRKGLKKESQEVLNRFHMSLSSYVNLLLQSLVDSEKKTFSELFEDIAVKLVKDEDKTKKKT